jgi:aminotransferase
MYESNYSIKELYCIWKNLFYNKFDKNKINDFKDKLTNKLKLDKNKCVITKSATDALFILFKTLNIKGEVIMPSMSYNGIANAIKDSGANIRFCDIEEDLNPSLFMIKKVYNKNCKALVLNNYSGVQIEDLYRIKNFCKEKNMLLIEDRSCNLMGGKNNHLADFVIYSFSETKIINTLQGGMIYINNNKHFNILEKLKLYTNLDIKEQDLILTNSVRVINRIGLDIAINQIDRIDNFIEKRLENENLYFKELQNDFYVPKINQYHKNWYWIRTDKDKRTKLINKMINNNIETNFNYYPLHMTSLYKNEKNILIKSEEMKDQILCLPIHNNLKKQDIKTICEILRRKN